MIYTLIKKDYRGGLEAIISFDSITSMDESWAATVSTQTVEKGFNISDNVNIEPEVYTIDAIISSYSLFLKGKEISWDGQRFNSNQTTDTQSHIKARDEIVDIFKSGSVLTLLEGTANSNNEDYEEKYRELKSGYVKETEDCVITALSISHPSAGTGAFMVNLKIQKIYVASVMVAELPEGETIALLTPMQAKEASVASNSSGGKSEDITENGGEVAMMPDDGTITPPESTAGMAWEDGYAILQRDLAKIRNNVVAVDRINEFAIRSKSFCKLVPLPNGTYTSRCIRL